MSTNKKAKERLIELYGAECFIEKLHLRKYDKPTHYTSKGQMKRMKQLTYHHIQMKKDGGPANVENGALLSAENHIWFHQQSANAQGYMNAIFQEYKRQMDECKVQFVDNIDLPFEVEAVAISIDEEGKLDYERLKSKEKSNYRNEMQRLKKEYEDR